MERISKEKFIDTIGALDKFEEFSSKLYNSGIYIEGTPVDELIGCIFDLLQQNWPNSFNMISSFCYELDFGRAWEQNFCLDEDGNDIRLDSIDALYEALNKYYN